jgi:predicted DNA-binding protein with PD1-like motif
MRSLTLSLLFLCPSMWAQETRREIAAASSPSDSKPNSKDVPEVTSIPTQFERVVVLRFKYETELLAALEKAVKDNKIQNGVILNAFGSVRNYHVHQVSNRTMPPKNVFVQDPATSADIAGMSGFVLNGRLHPHITLATPDKAFGGHLEPGTNVFTFAVVTIGVLPDKLDLGKLDDNTWR